MHTFKYPRTPRPTASWIGILICAALSFSCQEAVDDGSSNDAPAAGEITHTASDDDGDANAAAVLADERCEEPISAEIAPSEHVSDDTDIYRYDFSIQGSEINIGLVDADGDSMGRVEIDADADFDFRKGVLRQWEVTTSYHDDADDTDNEEAQAPVEQVLRAREVGQGRLWFEVIDRVGDDELIQWAVMGDEPEPLMQMLAVEVDAEPDPELEDRIQTSDGRVFETLELLDGDGERIDEDIIDGWIDEQIGDALTADPGWQRMTAAADDLALLRGADAHIELCRAAGANHAAEDLVQRSQGLCPGVKTDSEGEEEEWRQRQQAHCHADAAAEAERWLSVGLEINSVYGALSFGATITVAAVGAGLVGATGGGALVVFAGSVVAYTVVTNMVGNFVENNSEPIMDGLFTGGGVVTGDQEAGEEAADFLTGRHSARSGGDPHFDTFDGLSFSFHGAGEFVLVESTAGEPFQIQARQEPVGGDCPDLSMNTAVATTIGDQRIAIYAGDELLIDGEAVDLPGGILTFPGGGSVERLDSDSYELYWPTGEGLRITSRRSFVDDMNLVDVVVALPDHRQGQIQGLLGNFNDNPHDDIRPRNAEPLEPPVEWEDLTYEFGHSWRVDSDESLFDYGEGESHSSFVDENFPEQPTFLEDLPEEDREYAEGVCSDAGVENEAAFRGCVIDVACTGSDSLAESHTDRDPEVALEVTHEDSGEPGEPVDPPEFADDFPSISVGLFDRWCLLEGVGQMQCFTDDEELDYSFEDDASIVSIAVGHDYCGLDENGTLHCWQLSPQNLSEIDMHFSPYAGSFESLYMGPDDYGCVLDAAGNPQCWWGTTSINYPIDTGLPPADVELTSMALDARHMCGILKDGSLECWGNDDYGQATPPEGDDFVEIASDFERTCGLKDDGTVECWGKPFEESPGDINDIGPFETIALGGRTACGLKADGTIECWYAASSGGGIHTNPPSGSFVDLSLDLSRACAVDEDANVECW